jgi:predicted nucleic acid-binding protein
LRKILYLDSSALVKLVLREPETAALMGFLAAWPDRLSSVLARVEVLRALRRAKAERAARRRAHRVLSHVALVRLDDPVLEAAARLGPPELRSLDAIHLATARSVKEGLAGIVTYDSRLSRAAARLRLKVWSPA